MPMNQVKSSVDDSELEIYSRPDKLLKPMVGIMSYQDVLSWHMLLSLRSALSREAAVPQLHSTLLLPVSIRVSLSSAKTFKRFEGRRIKKGNQEENA